MRLTKTGLSIIYLLSFVFLISGTILFNGCKDNKKDTGDNFKPTVDTLAD